MYRRSPEELQLLLVHPGGPFYRNKDDRVWSIPKGLAEPGEDLLEAAVREFHEETGIAPEGPFHPLDKVQQRGGKVVHAWAFEGDWDPAGGIVSNSFELEWPPRSGRMRSYPEADRGDLFAPPEARARVNPAQVAFIDRLEAWLAEEAARDE